MLLLCPVSTVLYCLIQSCLSVCFQPRFFILCCGFIEVVFCFVILCRECFQLCSRYVFRSFSTVTCLIFISSLQYLQMIHTFTLCFHSLVFSSIIATHCHRLLPLSTIVSQLLFSKTSPELRNPSNKED